MRAFFDPETYKKIGSPDINSRIFIKRGSKKYYGNIHTIDYTSRKGIEVRISVDKVRLITKRDVEFKES